MRSFTARLAERVLAGQAPIVIGLDPRLDALPTTLRPGDSPAARIVAFYRETLPVIAKHAPCVKPNIAFFECYGADGYRAYEEVNALAQKHGLLVLGDIKRGDIGSTAEAYAEGHFRTADAVTLHPYLGLDSVQPFLNWCRDDRGGKAVFVLVRTSNPGAKDFQDLQVGGEPLCDVVARAVTRWGAELPRAEGYSPVGAVVGATWPQELARLRALLPHAWLLLPGVGAQGGKVQDLAAAFDRRGLGALVNQSRGVMQCFQPSATDWLDRLDRAARDFAAECRSVATGRSGAAGNP
ncbi:MAG: orotidine-5'-phosphate decarboxylase [Planctomycetes bacterium]|jgi:orotidine-5'-phosphate decarboxylase|nr:orotidine-5'-phosphate decarboxylase [Planctomycetota bacterium]